LDAHADVAERLDEKKERVQDAQVDGHDAHQAEREGDGAAAEHPAPAVQIREERWVTRVVPDRQQLQQLRLQRFDHQKKCKKAMVCSKWKQKRTVSSRQ
jgi:hypothetical protein